MQRHRIFHLATEYGNPTRAFAMPIKLASLSAEARRELARDLALPTAGSKATLVQRVSELFVVKGWNCDDVSSMHQRMSASMFLPRMVVPCLKPPLAFDTTEEKRSERLLDWVDDLQVFLDSHGENALDSTQRKCMLLHHSGPEVRRTFQSLMVIPADGESSYDSALRTLTEFFCVRENVFLERFVLDELQPLAGDSTQNFVLRLRSQARFCKLSCADCHCSFEDDRILEDALRNTDKPQIRSRCFEKRVTDLDTFLTIARDFEASLAESSTICRRSAVVSQADSTAMCSSEDKPSVSTAASSSAGCSGDNASSTTQDGKKRAPRSLKRKPPRLCKYCNTDHPFNRRLCPAWGKVCSACSSRHHFAVCCPNKGASCVEACTGACRMMEPSACVQGAPKFLESCT